MTGQVLPCLNCASIVWCRSKYQSFVPLQEWAAEARKREAEEVERKRLRELEKQAMREARKQVPVPEYSKF